MTRAPRAIARWSGLAACVLLGATLIASIFCTVSRRDRRYIQRVKVVWIEGGCVGALTSSRPFYGPRAVPGVVWHIDVLGEARFGPLLPRVTPLLGASIQQVELPLWIPLVLVAVPTALLWRHHLSHRPGRCARCSYDLTGNTSGICPECGNPIG